MIVAGKRSSHCTNHRGGDIFLRKAMGRTRRMKVTSAHPRMRKRISGLRDMVWLLFFCRRRKGGVRKMRR